MFNNLAILLHIVFGFVAYAGSLTLADAFGVEFKDLSFKKKFGIAAAFIGGVASTVLGIGARFEGNAVMIGFIIINILFAVYTFGVRPAMKRAKAAKITAETELA